MLQAFTDQIRAVACWFWPVKRARILMQIQAHQQWLQHFWIQKATFLERCAEPTAVLQWRKG